MWAEKFFVYDRELRRGNFDVRKILGCDLQGKILGIIGIGKLVASKASKGFGMKVISFRRHIDSVKMEFSLMKPGAFLINTARGEVVDEDALINALLDKKIAGAAVDVFTGEIPSRYNPLFKNCESCIV